MRYLLQDTPTIREREFVRTLADMIIGLLEQRDDAPGGRRRSRRLAPSPGVTRAGSQRRRNVR